MHISMKSSLLAASLALLAKVDGVTASFCNGDTATCATILLKAHVVAGTHACTECTSEQLVQLGLNMAAQYNAPAYAVDPSKVYVLNSTTSAVKDLLDAGGLFHTATSSCHYILDTKFSVLDKACIAMGESYLSSLLGKLGLLQGSNRNITSTNHGNTSTTHQPSITSGSHSVSAMPIKSESFPFPSPHSAANHSVTDTSIPDHTTTVDHTSSPGRPSATFVPPHQTFSHSSDDASRSFTHSSETFSFRRPSQASTFARRSEAMFTHSSESFSFTHSSASGTFSIRPTDSLSFSRPSGSLSFTRPTDTFSFSSLTTPTVDPTFGHHTTTLPTVSFSSKDHTVSFSHFTTISFTPITLSHMSTESLSFTTTHFTMPSHTSTPSKASPTTSSSSNRNHFRQRYHPRP